MKTYLITYNNPNILLDYLNSNIKAEINSISTYWAKPMENIWLIKTYSDRELIINRLRVLLPLNSKILVIEVTNDWIAFNLPSDVVEWMKTGL